MTTLDSSRLSDPMEDRSYQVLIGYSDSLFPPGPVRIKVWETEASLAADTSGGHRDSAARQCHKSLARGQGSCIDTGGAWVLLYRRGTAAILAFSFLPPEGRPNDGQDPRNRHARLAPNSTVSRERRPRSGSGEGRSPVGVLRSVIGPSCPAG